MQGSQGRECRREIWEAKKVGPGQRWELDLSGLLSASGDERLVQTGHLWEAA